MFLGSLLTYEFVKLRYLVERSEVNFPSYAFKLREQLYNRIEDKSLFNVLVYIIITEYHIQEKTNSSDRSDVFFGRVRCPGVDCNGLMMISKQFNIFINTLKLLFFFNNNVMD